MRPALVLIAMAAIAFTSFYAANPHRVPGSLAALIVACILLVIGALKGDSK